MASSVIIKINCTVHLAERILKLFVDPEYSGGGSVVIKCRDGTEKSINRSVWRASSPILGELLEESSEQTGSVPIDASAATAELLARCLHFEQNIEVGIAQIIPLFAASMRYKIDILTADLMESFTLGTFREIMRDVECWSDVHDEDMIYLRELLSQHEVPSFDRTALCRNLLRWSGQAKTRKETVCQILEDIVTEPVETEETTRPGYRDICYLRSGGVIRRIEIGRGNHSVTIDRRKPKLDADGDDVFRLGLAFSIQDRRLCARRAIKTDGSSLGDERRFGISYGDFDGLCSSSCAIYVWRSQEIFIVDPKHETPPSKILDTTFHIEKVLPFTKDSRDLFGVTEKGTELLHIIDREGVLMKSFPELGDVKAISERFVLIGLPMDVHGPNPRETFLVKLTADLEIESDLNVSSLFGNWKLVDVMIEKEIVLCLVEKSGWHKLLDISDGATTVVLTEFNPPTHFVRCID